MLLLFELYILSSLKFYKFYIAIDTEYSTHIFLLLCVSLNCFIQMFHVYTPWKQGSALKISRSIEMKHCLRMGLTL